MAQLEYGGSRRAAVQLTFVALAIGTRLVRIKLEQTLNDLLVLGGLIRGRTARHDSSSIQSGNNNNGGGCARGMED